MAQHFLLSAAARTLSLRDIYVGGEEKAFDAFCKLRWAATQGEPVCPKCGCLESYKITTRRKFKCSACYAQYSPTSGTVLAWRKLAYVDLLAAICILANAAKGVSALQLARDIGVHAKTAWILAHKIRQALGAEADGIMLDGVVEIDGAVFSGSIRPANKAEDRIDRRLAEHQTGKRRTVIVTRQRRGRTRTFVVKHESDGVEIAKQYIAPKAVVHADEASHGTRYTLISRRTGSIIRLLTAPTAFARTKPKAIFRAYAAWLVASTITSARSTCTPMRRMRLGWKIIAGWTMARWRTEPCG